MSRWVNTQLSKQWTCAASSRPAFQPNIKMLCHSCIIVFSTENISDWPHSFLSTLTALGGINYPTKSLRFLPWASDLHSWCLWHEAALETAVDVPKESSGTTETVSRISKGPRETTHLPTIWWHRLKHICFGSELHQLSVQWYREQKPLLALGSVLY